MTHHISRRAVLIGSIAILPIPSVAQAQSVRTVTDPTGDETLNLRSGPGTRYSVIQSLPNGTDVIVLETRGNWLYVREIENATLMGWIYGPYTSVSIGRFRVADPTGDGWLNLRTGPGTNHAIIQQLNNGRVVNAFERQGNWLRVGVFLQHWPNGGPYVSNGWLYEPYTVRY